MKNGILLILRPFVIDQKYYVFKDGVAVREKSAPYSQSFTKELMDALNTYDLDTINVSGPYNYAIQIIEELSSYSQTKFKEKPIAINILSKRS